MKVDTTFVSPSGPNARFPEREMRVIKVMELDGESWVDAVPVRYRPGDQYWHCTYQLDEDGHVIAI